MTAFSTDIIKEIAEQLDCGFRAFLHKITAQLVFLPDTDNYPDIDMDAWKSECELLDNNFTDYQEIEKWSSSEAFQFMADFTEQLTENKHLQNRLKETLNRRNPFREFKSVIDSSGDYRQQWFDFKNKRQQEFVERQLNRI